MFFESLTPINYGPFSTRETITFEPDVTVLTGANDSGKTSLLRLIHRLCTLKAAAVQEDEFNTSNVHDVEGEWNSTAEFGADAVFHMQEYDRQPPSEQTIRFMLWKRKAVIVTDDSSHTETPEGPSVALPTALMFPSTHDIRNIIDLRNPNPLESAFLRQAFGEDFEPTKLIEAATTTAYNRRLGAASRRLTGLAKEILPNSFDLTYTLEAEPGTREKLLVHLNDQHGGNALLESRGSGVRRALSLLAGLMARRPGHECYILIDEPELSLHADAQHHLRRFLEKLADDPSVRVVYSTHSPAMINPLRPQAVRLFTRTTKGSKATAVVDNCPYKDNFVSIRSSLGLSPADSLLFAPVTILVEGDTEIVALPPLIKKLETAGVKGFTKACMLLSQTHFLNGMGDSLPYYCNLAKSQGAKVIVFVDGDKKKRQRRKLEQVGADAIIELPEDHEFEDLVCRDVYFEALRAELADQDLKWSIGDFQKWQGSQSSHIKTLMFSKQVWRWIQDRNAPFEPEKAKVMGRAVELADAEAIRKDEIVRLLDDIRRLLDA